MAPRVYRSGHPVYLLFGESMGIKKGQACQNGYADQPVECGRSEFTGRRNLNFVCKYVLNCSLVRYKGHRIQLSKGFVHTGGAEPASGHSHSRCSRGQLVALHRVLKEDG